MRGEREEQHRRRHARAAAWLRRGTRDRRRRPRKACGFPPVASAGPGRRPACRSGRLRAPGMWPEARPGRGSGASPRKRAARACVDDRGVARRPGALRTCVEARAPCAARIVRLNARGLRLRLAALERKARALPGRQPAIQHAHVLRAEDFAASTRRAAPRRGRCRHRRRSCRSPKGRARRPPRRRRRRPAACAAGRSSGRRSRRCRRTPRREYARRETRLCRRASAPARYQEASTTFTRGSPSRSFSHSGETRSSVMSASAKARRMRRFCRPFFSILVTASSADLAGRAHMRAAAGLQVDRPVRRRSRRAARGRCRSAASRSWCGPAPDCRRAPRR